MDACLASRRHHEINQSYAKAAADRKAKAEAKAKAAAEKKVAKEAERQRRREAKLAAKEAKAQAAAEAAALARSRFVASSNPLEYVNRYAKAVPYPGMPAHKEAAPPLEISQESDLWHAWPLGAVDVPHPLLPGDPVESPADGEALVACAHLEPVARLLLQLQKTFGGLLYGTQWSNAWGLGGEWPAEVRAAGSVEALGGLARELLDALPARVFRESWQMPYELKLSRAYKAEVEAVKAAAAAKEAAAEAQARRVAAAAAREQASRQAAAEREEAKARAAAAAARAKKQETAAAAAAAGMTVAQYSSYQQQQQQSGARLSTANADGASPMSGLSNGGAAAGGGSASPQSAGPGAEQPGGSGSGTTSPTAEIDSAEYRSPKKQRRRSSRPGIAPTDLVVSPNSMSPSRSSRGRRKASLGGGSREAFGLGSGGLGGGEYDDDEDGGGGALLSDARMSSGLDHSKMSDAAFDRMLADMEADRDDGRGGGGGGSGGGKAAAPPPSFPPQGYYDTYQRCEWRVRCYIPDGQRVAAAPSAGGRAGSASAAAAAAAMPPPPPFPTSSSKQRRRTRRRHYSMSASGRAAKELGIGETLLRGQRFFPATSRKPPPARLARAMARRGTHRPMPGFCYVSSAGTSSAAVDGAKVPVSALWHARVARCRSAAELAVHLRSLQVVIDADLVEQATSSGLGVRAARGGGGSEDQVNVEDERWSSAAGEVEVLLKVWTAGRRVSGVLLPQELCRCCYCCAAAAWCCFLCCFFLFGWCVVLTLQ